MSTESAKTYIERLNTDEDFRKRINEAETVEARKAVIEAEGFDFTMDEMKSVSNELSDEELDRVAGGVANSEARMRARKISQ